MTVRAVASKTITGVKVKSKGEKFVADTFTKMKIEWKYEQKVWVTTTAVGRWYSRPKKYAKKYQFAPDFYLPELGIYVEYFGLYHIKMDYKQKTNWKMRVYAENDLDIIALFPDDLDDRLAIKLLKDIKRIRNIRKGN